MGFLYSGRNYTDYDGPYTSWYRIYLHLAEFLDRLDGQTLYCHDVSCGFSALAGMYGINLPYYYLGIGMDTYDIRGIGHSSWSDFRWTAHGVNSLDEGEHIFDACLNLNGHETPGGSSPIDLEVISIPVDEYFEKLTPDAISIQHSGYPYIIF
jgi:hypothetical protein